MNPLHDLNTEYLDFSQQAESPRGSPLYSWQTTSPIWHSTASPVRFNFLGNENDNRERNRSRSRSRNKSEGDEEKGIIMLLGHSELGTKDCECNLSTNGVEVHTLMVGGIGNLCLMFRDPDLLVDYFKDVYKGAFEMTTDELAQHVFTQKQNYRINDKYHFRSFETRHNPQKVSNYFGAQVAQNRDVNHFCERVWSFSGKREREGVVLLMTKIGKKIKYQRLYEDEINRFSKFELKKSRLIEDIKKIHNIKHLTIIDHGCTDFHKSICPEMRSVIEIERRFGGNKVTKTRRRRSKRTRKSARFHIRNR